jgi:tetratricopeptide (TPR) repeat protein
MPPGQREELFAAWRTFFQRIADVDPVILVFKDLHWADAGLLEFIEHLLAWSKASPIYVLAMTRPDLLERYPSWGSGVRNATTISLEPLPDAAMAELLRGTVPGLPDEAVSGIVARAEGIPLYAVETLRMLIDRGQLVASANGYELSGPIDRIAVPETLHALVAARIDANSPEDRGLLADGAILGQSFTGPALAGMIGQAEDAILPGLERLVRRELLIRDDDPRSPERGQYRFVQGVVREVAYDTLSKTDRRAKHLAAARYFEALGDDELAGVLATHYLEALRATGAGPESDALAAQARIALRAAADRAMTLHAWSVAHRHLVDALEVTRDPAERAGLAISAAQMANNLTLPDAVDIALEGVRLATEADDLALRNRAISLAGEAYVNRSLGAEAFKLLEPAAETLGVEDPAAASILNQLARLQMMSDRHEEAIISVERALQAAAHDDDSNMIAQGLITRASSLMSLDRAEEAGALFRGAIELADRKGHISAALRARNNLISSLSDSPMRDLLVLFDESVDLARRYGLVGWLAQHLFNRAGLLLIMGDWPAARRDVDELGELAQSEMQRAVAASFRAQVDALEGDLDGARTELAESARLVALIDTAPQVTAITGADGLTYLLMGDPATARKLVSAVSGGGNDGFLQQTVARASAWLGDASAVAAAATAQADRPSHERTQPMSDEMQALVASVSGRWDEARVAFNSAVEAFRSRDEHLDAAITQLMEGLFLGSRFAEAEAAGTEAEGWFSERGASGAVELMRAAFRGTPAPAATGSARAKRASSEVEVS